VVGTSRRSRPEFPPPRGAAADAARYCTLNVAVAVTDPPRVQVTAAFAVPGFVVADTFQVQDTSPPEPAVGVVLSPAAADTVPDGQVTFAEQTAPGDVLALMLAVEPGMAGPGRLTNVTESEAGRGATVGFGVGRGVGRAVAGGVVAPAASGMP
jgi:hypothetical protein